MPLKSGCHITRCVGDVKVHFVRGLLAKRRLAELYGMNAISNAWMLRRPVWLGISM